jgi:amino acid transporter
VAEISTIQDDDERRLAELGYKQELSRTWSGFSNFAISFSIISILAGCFTTFYFGWNNGGPIAISIGWPVIAALILVIGFCMSELVSAYPTSGGIYWWASKLGGIKAGYYTGWLNLVGLIAIVASVAYGAATFFDYSISRFSESWAAGYSLERVFVIFLIILLLTALANIFSSHLLAVFNNISVWWHVVGAAIVVIILVFFLKEGATHWGVTDVFTGRVNNTFGLHGSTDGALNGAGTSGPGFWFYVLPLGFLLTQYTITGYDASAHLSEETHGAADNAAKGIWRSIFYSAIGGWVLLLTFLFAVQDPIAVSAGGGGVQVILDQALTPQMSGTVLLIATIGQLFCTTACLTSASRMLFAFSRDGAVPGAKLWSRVNKAKTPVYAVIGVTVAGLILTLPALWKVNIGSAEEPIYTVTAFFAVVSIGVLGLYLAFAIPIYYRWRAGANFKQGSWNLGNKWKWMAPIAVLEILITSVYFILPLYPAGAPGFMRGFLGAPSAEEVPFDWKSVNYAPLVLGAILIALWIGWHLSAKKWFTGPKVTIDLPAGVSSADEIALEHEHKGHHQPPES